MEEICTSENPFLMRSGVAILIVCERNLAKRRVACKKQTPKGNGTDAMVQSGNAAQKRKYKPPTARSRDATKESSGGGATVEGAVTQSPAADGESDNKRGHYSVKQNCMIMNHVNGEEGIFHCGEKEKNRSAGDSSLRRWRVCSLREALMVLRPTEKRYDVMYSS
jgi:hypothetical protein